MISASTFPVFGDWSARVEFVFFGRHLFSGCLFVCLVVFSVLRGTQRVSVWECNNEQLLPPTSKHYVTRRRERLDRTNILLAHLRLYNENLSQLLFQRSCTLTVSVYSRLGFSCSSPKKPPRSINSDLFSSHRGAI